MFKGKRKELNYFLSSEQLTGSLSDRLVKRLTDKLTDSMTGYSTRYDQQKTGLSTQCLNQ